MKLQGDRSTPGRQSVSAVEMTSQRRSSISSQVGEVKVQTEHGTEPFLCLSYLFLYVSNVLTVPAINELSKHGTEHSAVHGFTTAAATSAAATSAAATVSTATASRINAPPVEKPD